MFFSLVLHFLTRYGQIPWFRFFFIYNVVFLKKSRRRPSEENFKALVLFYYDSFISYEYFVSLNFDASLYRFWYSCFDIRLMFLIHFLCDMYLSDFLSASLDQCNIPGLRARKKKIGKLNLQYIWGCMVGGVYKGKNFRICEGLSHFLVRRIGSTSPDHPVGNLPTQKSERWNHRLKGRVWGVDQLSFLN